MARKSAAVAIPNDEIFEVDIDEMASPPKKTKAKKAKAQQSDSTSEKKPRKSNIEKDKYGFKVGSLKSKAAAMYGSKGGATLQEVKSELDSSQLNLITDLEKSGQWMIRKEKEDGSGKKKVTRYFIVDRN